MFSLTFFYFVKMQLLYQKNDLPHIFLFCQKVYNLWESCPNWWYNIGKSDSIYNTWILILVCRLTGLASWLHNLCSTRERENPPSCHIDDTIVYYWNHVNYLTFKYICLIAFLSYNIKYPDSSKYVGVQLVFLFSHTWMLSLCTYISLQK